jgi:hypothetical protein
VLRGKFGGGGREVRKLAYKCMIKLSKTIFIDLPRLYGIEE